MEKLLEISSSKLWVLLLSILIVRYVLVAGIPYLWLYVIRKKKYNILKIQRGYPDIIQVFKEVKYSLMALLIYSLGIWLFLYWLQNGYTKNYAEISQFGISYFVLSIFLMIIVHDTYSY